MGHRLCHLHRHHLPHGRCSHHWQKCQSSYNQHKVLLWLFNMVRISHGAFSCLPPSSDQQGVFQFGFKWSFSSATAFLCLKLLLTSAELIGKQGMAWTCLDLHYKMLPATLQLLPPFSKCFSEWVNLTTWNSFFVIWGDPPYIKKMTTGSFSMFDDAWRVTNLPLSSLPPQTNGVKVFQWLHSCLSASVLERSQPRTMLC